MAGSVSSHLTPEPERRLWLILDTMKQAVDAADRRVGFVTLFAALELYFFKPGEYGGPVNTLTAVALAAALPLGLYALSPLTAIPKWLTALETQTLKHAIEDCLVAPEEIAQYSHAELIHRYDKYLGGGITATQYHEDIVGQVVVQARVAARKQILLRATCKLVGLAQLGLFLHLI
jgi:hypothetical protein